MRPTRILIPPSVPAITAERDSVNFVDALAISGIAGSPGGDHRQRKRGIFVNIFMPTTVHVPPALLKSVDRRAKALGLSRNRLIVRALERVVSDRTGWAPEFLEKLRQVDPMVVESVDQLVTHVRSSRRSKRPPVL
jgi:hypothetical protein